MKQIVIAMAAALMLSSTAMAQDDKQGKRDGKRPDKTEMIQHRTDEVAKKYNLTEQQKEQLKALNTKYADNFGRGMGPRGGRGGRPDMQRQGDNKRERPQQGQRPQLTDEQKAQMEKARQEREESMKAYDAELQKIMTPEQYQAYKADMEKNRRQGGGRGPRGPRAQQQ